MSIRCFVRAQQAFPSPLTVSSTVSDAINAGLVFGIGCGISALNESVG